MVKHPDRMGWQANTIGYKVNDTVFISDYMVLETYYTVLKAYYMVLEAYYTVLKAYCMVSGAYYMVFE